MTDSITEHLLNTYRGEQLAATMGNHPFLLSVANGSVSLQGLERWLVQDHLYASMGYIRLIGHMLLRAPLPVGIQQGREEEKHWADRARGMLADALSNIHRSVRHSK